MSSAFAAPRGARTHQSALLWLALQMSRPARGAVVARLSWLAAGTALAAGPLIVWLAAGLSCGSRPEALPAGTDFGLALTACPGIALILAAAHCLAADRAEVSETLRQVGAERTAAWLLPALRIALAALIGGIVGAVVLSVLDVTALRDLPAKAPLRATLAAVSGDAWATSTALILLLLVSGALLASGTGHRFADRLRGRTTARIAARAQTPSAAAAEAETEADVATTAAPQAEPETT